MKLQPGSRLIVPPSFHLPVDWADRALLGAGVEREGEGFVPRLPWRPLDDEEQSFLFPDPTLPCERAAWPDCLCLFRLPQHLLAAWGRLVERALGAGKPGLDGLDAFVVDVARFLAFKEVPVPEGAVLDLIASQPGQRSTAWSGQAPGLAFNLAASTPFPLPAEARWPRLWGIMNLGEEPTALLFINLPPRGLLAEVERCAPSSPVPATFGELAERFLTFCADYPPVRLRIEPGEGLRFPAGGLVVAGCTLEKQEPDVLLVVRHGGE